MLSFIQIQCVKGSFACIWFVWSELVDFIWQAWPDLKQPLRLSGTETEMEKRVRSNQHCCHDYVHFTPTCNQATGRSATKLMWQWQVDWMRKGGQEAWGKALFGPVQPSSVQPVTLARPGTLYRDQLLHRELQAKVGTLNKNISPLSCFVLIAKQTMQSTLSLTEINTGQENVFISFH